MMKSLFVGSALCATFIFNTAFASEAEDMAAGIKCMPAKKIIKLLRKFDGMKPEKKNTVSVIPEMQLTADEGRTLPERVYFRSGATEHPFIMDSDGVVTDFARIGGMSKSGELCMQNQNFTGASNEEVGVSLSLEFDISFKNTSGTHTLAELVDGAKDGKSHYKKMLPGPVALLVPKMTHVGINFLNADEMLQPNIFAVKSGEPMSGLQVEKFGGMFVVGIEDLQNLGADSLKIEGGEYRLTPIPSIAKMKKLGFGNGGQDEEEATNKED